MKSLILLMILAISVSQIEANFDKTYWYTQVKNYENLPNTNEICSNLTWQSDNKLDGAEDTATGDKLNWFDMTPDNMQLVLKNAYNDPLGGNSQWWEQSNDLNWPGTENAWVTPTSSDTISGFILHGRQVSMGLQNGVYMKNAHINKVIWLIEKFTPQQIGEDLTADNMSKTYQSVGQITQILCIGRWVDAGTPIWKSSRSQFVIYEPFFSFLEGVGDHHDDFPSHYFHGTHCPLIPVRPIAGEITAECVWAIKLGKYFIDGSVTNEIGSGEGVRTCIQQIYGKRTHTLKCLFSGIDQNDGFAHVHSLTNESGYTDAELTFLGDYVSQLKGDDCLSFEQDDINSDRYKCICPVGRVQKTTMADDQWTLGSDGDFTSEGYSCGDLMTNNLKDCVDIDDNGDCSQCKESFTLTVEKTCIEASATLPVGCLSGINSSDNNTVGCRLCKENFFPRGGVCEISGELDEPLQMNHCQYQFVVGVGEQNKCYQCSKTHVLRKNDDNSGSGDVCVSLGPGTPERQFGLIEAGYKGCRYLKFSIDSMISCAECKRGFSQTNN